MSLTAEGEAKFTVKIEEEGIKEAKADVEALEQALNKIKKQKNINIDIDVKLPTEKVLKKLKNLYKKDGPISDILKKGSENLNNGLTDTTGDLISSDLEKKKTQLRDAYAELVSNADKKAGEVKKAQENFAKAFSDNGFDEQTLPKELEKRAKAAARALTDFENMDEDLPDLGERADKYADTMMRFLAAQEAFGKDVRRNLDFDELGITDLVDIDNLDEFRDRLASTFAEIKDISDAKITGNEFKDWLGNGENASESFRAQFMHEVDIVNEGVNNLKRARREYYETKSSFEEAEYQKKRHENMYASKFREDEATGASLRPDQTVTSQYTIYVKEIGLDTIEQRIEALKKTPATIDLSLSQNSVETLTKISDISKELGGLEKLREKVNKLEERNRKAREKEQENETIVPDKDVERTVALDGKKTDSTDVDVQPISVGVELDEESLKSQISSLSSLMKGETLQLKIETVPKISELFNQIRAGIEKPITIKLNTAEAERLISSMSGTLRDFSTDNKIDDPARKEFIGNNFKSSVEKFLKNKKTPDAVNLLASKRILDESGDNDFISSVLRKRIKSDGKKATSIGKILDSAVKEAESLMSSSQGAMDNAIEKRKAEILAQQQKAIEDAKKTDATKQSKKKETKQQPEIEVDPASIDTALSKIQEAQSKPIRIDVEPNVDGFYEKVYDAVQEQKKKFENDIRDKAYQDYLDNDPEYKKALQERNAFESKSRSMDQYSSFDTYKSNTKKTDKVVDLRNAVREYMAGKNEGKISDDVYKKLFASADRSLFSSESQKGLYSELVKGLSVFDGKEAHSLSPDDVRALVQSALVDYQRSKKYEASKDSVRDKALGIYKDMPGYEDIIAMRKGVAQQEAAKFRKVKSDFDAFKASDSGSIIAQKQMEASVAASKAVKENGILSSLIPDLDKLKSEPIKLTIDVDASQVDSLLQSLEALETKFGQINAKKSEIENTPIRELADNIDENKNLISPDIQLSPDALANVNNAIKGLQIEPIKIDLEPQTDGFYDRLLNSVKDGKKKYQDDILDSWAGYSLSENKEYQKAMREKSKWEAESAPKLEGITNVSKFKQETTKGMKTQQFMKAFEDYVIECGSKSAKEISKETYENLLGAMDASFFDKDAKGFLKAIQPAIRTRDGNGGFQYFNHDEIMQMAGEALSGYIEAYKGDFDKSLKDVTDKDYDKILKSAGVKEKRVQNQKARSDVIKPITNAYDEGKRIDKTIRDFEEGANREAKEKAKVDPLSDALTGGIEAYIAQEKTLKFKADLSQVEQALAKLQGKELKLKVSEKDVSADESEKSTKKKKSSKSKETESGGGEAPKKSRGIALLDDYQRKTLDQVADRWRELSRMRDVSTDMIQDMQISIRDGITGVQKNVEVGQHLNRLDEDFKQNMYALREGQYENVGDALPYYKNIVSSLKEFNEVMNSPLPKGKNSLGSLLFTSKEDTSVTPVERAKNDIQEISKQLKDKGYFGVEVTEGPKKNRKDGEIPSYRVKYRDGDMYHEGVVSKSDYASGSGSSMARFDMKDIKVRDASPMKNWANQVKHKIQTLSAYYVSDYILDAGMQQLREGYQFVSDLDSALTNISMTMNTSTKSLSNLGKSAIQTGVDLSTNASNVLEAVTIYANANETTDSILEKATPTLMLANASGDSAANASNYLQAVVNQFDGMDGQEKRIVNSYEKISAGLAMDFSQGISGMAEAVTNAGSVASEAGLWKA